MTQKTRNAPPRAMAMLESLRGLGYSTAAALADIVDNSISAGASEVRIDFVWDGPNSRIVILDDGRGMDDAELEERHAPRRQKSARRSATPAILGRFGMGLKTASFSQCRRLTVASVKDGVHKLPALGSRRACGQPRQRLASFRRSCRRLQAISRQS
jgi:hypothetical protein